jgi:hypothetical protein
MVTAQGAVVRGLQTATPKEPHMSAIQQPASIESNEVPGGEGASATSLPGSVEAASARVYEELGQLAEFMPQRYREVFCFRWGLRGQFPHLVNQAARKFEVSRSAVELMLDRSLWNVARHARAQQLPALREMLGEKPERWAERAWAHAERRWGNQVCEFSETVLVLSIAGLDVPEAHRVARQHVVDIGLGRDNQWGRPMTDREHAHASRHAVDRMLAHVIWPSNTVKLSGLDQFSVRRPLPAWTAPKVGVFHSPKLGRLVQFESELELVILRQLDSDPRVVEYGEQPVTIPYVLDGEAREYTPDVMVRLDDGRAFIVEAKPEVGLGDFTNWMKWASLARWCEQAGIGFWIGSPQRSITQHRCTWPDPGLRELVVDEVGAGEVSAGDYTALRGLVSNDQLGLIATAELLDWRADLRRVRHAKRPDRTEAQQLWALIDQHRDVQPADSPLGSPAFSSRA